MAIRLAVPAVLAIVGIACFAIGATFEGEILLFIALVRLVLVLALRNRYGQGGNGAFIVQQSQFGQAFNQPSPVIGQAPYGAVPAPAPAPPVYGQPQYGQTPTPPPPFGQGPTN
jgi:hypothetical protein